MLNLKKHKKEKKNKKKGCHITASVTKLGKRCSMHVLLYRKKDASDRLSRLQGYEADSGTKQQGDININLLQKRKLDFFLSKAAASEKQEQRRLAATL